MGVLLYFIVLYFVTYRFGENITSGLIKSEFILISTLSSFAGELLRVSILFFLNDSDVYLLLLMPSLSDLSA